MLWLADALFGPRVEREGHADERRPPVDGHVRSAERARGRALAGILGRGFAALGRGAGSTVAVLGQWREPYRRDLRRRLAIRELRSLDDHMLADIGLSRNDIPAVAAGLFEGRRDLRSPVAAARTAGLQEQRACGGSAVSPTPPVEIRRAA
jgi:uncharacterized protein YjiS (DUF1127 family)